MGILRGDRNRNTTTPNKRQDMGNKATKTSDQSKKQGKKSKKIKFQYTTFNLGMGGSGKSTFGKVFFPTYSSSEANENHLWGRI